MVILMTCIVGIAHEGKVYMGGERGVSDENTIMSMSVPKIHTRGDWVFGYSDSVAIGQLLDFIALPPAGKNPYTTLRLNIVEEYKKAIESYSIVSPEHSADILIGAQGRLFEFSTTDFSVIEIGEGSVGSGHQIALGSLYTTRTWKDQEKRIKVAIEAAIEFSTGCAKPIDFLMK
jgi:ATP-dependent protease HslVU (ClpYQ) peptidase subunit